MSSPPHSPPRRPHVSDNNNDPRPPVHPVAHRPPATEHPGSTPASRTRTEPTETESTEEKTGSAPTETGPPKHPTPRPVQSMENPSPEGASPLPSWTKRSVAGAFMGAALKGATLKKASTKSDALVSKAVEQQAASTATKPLTPRDQELMASGFVATCVAEAGTGLLDNSRAALKDLQDATKSAMDTDTRAKLLQSFLTGMFADPAVLGKNPEFVAELLKAADGVVFRSEAGPDFLAGKLALLGDAAPAVAGQTLLKIWNQPTWATPTLLDWTCRTIPKADWNDRPRGLAARAYNALWEAERFDLIRELITAGVDSMQSCSDGTDMGRRREGIWSGYVQPLQHLLGNYLKPVATGPLPLPPVPPPPDQDDWAAKAKVTQAEQKVQEVEKNNRKIAAAKVILRTLEETGTAGILTTFAAVEKSQLVDQFDKEPGTVWGFEDVRLPYVQACRETPKGAQPIRMWDLWTAIEPTLSKSGYTDLLTKPAETIPACVKDSVDTIRTGIADKNPQYAFAISTADPDGEKFLAAFAQQAKSYLEFFAAQVPKAKFATAQKAGSNIGKLMGAIGCKVGLWWAKAQRKPVYYCLDGIDMTEVVNYKSFKNKAINTVLQAPDSSRYCEVITFAELREILRNWRDLKDVVRFVERGTFVKPDDPRIAAWRTAVLLDATAEPARLGPDRTVFQAELDKLDPKLIGSLDGVQAKRVVAQSETLKLVLGAQLALVGPVLLNECEALYGAGVLPARLGDLYYTADIATDQATRTALVGQLREALVSVCDTLRPALVDAVNRRFPDVPPPSSPAPVDQDPNLSTLLDDKIDS
jgi:hypothetical protein